MFRVSAVIISLVLLLAGSGCAIVEVGMRNPVVGLETVAVAPFFNLSQERTVDGREFALDYYSELQKVPGFEVLPVGVTERAMVENGISLAGPEDAVRLAKILDVDAVVVGAITDYDPYNPRIGLKVAWYSPRQWLFLPNQNPNVSVFNRSADAPIKRPGRPVYGTPRAQSPDSSDEWASVDSGELPANVEEGNWESADFAAGASAMLMADASSRQNQPVLPDGTSLLVPVKSMNVSSAPVVSQQPRQVRTVEFQNAERPSSLVPAPPAENVVLTQGTRIGPSIDPRGPQLDDSTIAPRANTPKQLSEADSAGAAPRPFRQPPSKKPIRQPASSSLSEDNPFRRHLVQPAPEAELNGTPPQSVPEIQEQFRYLTPPRIAESEPEFPGGSESATQLPPLPSAPPASESVPKPTGPAMKTPLFPMYQTDSPTGMATKQPTHAPALIYEDQVLMPPSEFNSTEPLMAYVRLFDATDRRLIARLSDYLELTGQLRSGDLEAYMKRSEFFRKFTAHVMISEMLQLHGGEARRQLVLKPRQYR